MYELKQLNCKCCGAPLALAQANGRVIPCKFCGNVYILAKDVQNERLLNFLDSGELALSSCRFEEALAAYQKAAELDKDEPEAYFGKALAKFKIQYLKDGVNNCLQPICHEITDKKFSNDPDYKRAYDKATAEQRAAYQNKAKEIDYIQGEFYRLKSSGLDYDCFICAKVTDDITGARTADYKSADDIYFALKKDYKPFFSERELEGVTGADYEARILYALYSSECMLVVCHNGEYLQTKWVKNEYTRFLKLVNDEEKETDSITVAFKGKPIEKLPGRAGKIQGIDLGKLGALSRVEAFVKNHTPEARKRKEAAAAQKKREEEEREKRFAEQQRLLEEQRKSFEEQQQLQKEELEKQRKSLEEQQKKIAEQLEKLRNAPAGLQSAQDISDDELLERMERARAERERREEEERRRREEERRRREEERRRREEEERKRREEEKRIAREKAEAERKRREEEERIARDFEISGTVLIKYLGAGGDVKIPAGVTSIDEHAFDGCVNIASISVAENNTAFSIQDGVLYNKTKTVLIKCPVVKTSITIPASVTSIGEWAFFDCSNLTSITIPESVTSIGESAFNGCTSLKSITIPESVTSIGKDAFRGCRYLTSITISARVTSIGDGMFSDCVNLTSITIPDGVTSIGERAFDGCTNLTNITIPDGVTSIGERAFDGCTNLTNITIPEGVTSIGAYAFRSCTSFTCIIIPASVITIGESAFYWCGNLTVCCISKSKPEEWDGDWNLIENGVRKRVKVYWDCSEAEYNQKIEEERIAHQKAAAERRRRERERREYEAELLIKPWIAKDYPTLINYTKSKFKIKGTELKKYIGQEKDVAIPYGVTSICKKSFYFYRNLYDVIIPDSVTKIGDSAFFCCNLVLSRIRIPGSVVSIGKEAFRGCLRLSTVEISEGVTSIGDKAFAYCPCLNKIVIPKSVLTLGSKVFMGCRNLTIYCCADKKPDGWKKNWNSKCKVVWGYKD